jgi:hypothetical protein
MRLSQPQTNILAFDWCLILRVSIFVIILLSKKYFLKIKVVKLGRIYDPGHMFGRLSREAWIDMFLSQYIYIYIIFNFF